VLACPYHHASSGHREGFISVIHDMCGHNDPNPPNGGHLKLPQDWVDSLLVCFETSGEHGKDLDKRCNDSTATLQSGIEYSTVLALFGDLNKMPLNMHRATKGQPHPHESTKNTESKRVWVHTKLETHFVSAFKSV